MGRDINTIMIVDNSPHSFLFNPQNAIPCESWFSDKEDTELLEFIPQLEKLADASVTDVKIKLKELGISGTSALNREMGGGQPDTDEDSYEESYTGSENQEDDN